MERGLSPLYNTPLRILLIAYLFGVSTRTQ